MLDEDADDDSVSKSLEAYLLWLFGYVMFNNGHGNSVDKILVPYAQEIADTEPGVTSLFGAGARPFLQRCIMGSVKAAGRLWKTGSSRAVHFFCSCGRTRGSS